MMQFQIAICRDDEINKTLEAITQQISANTRETNALVSLRNSLLPKLMSGEIDVSRVDLTQLNNHLFFFAKLSPFALFAQARTRKVTQMNEIEINKVCSIMQHHLTWSQMMALRHALEDAASLPLNMESTNSELLTSFLMAKEVEGCSARTIGYYRATLEHLAATIPLAYTQMTTNDLRSYLSDYETNRRASKTTIDNIRRIMSSFFSWLEDEDYVVKSPVRRIKRVKTPSEIKETFSDEDLERMRDACRNKRDLAIVDFLASTGVRVGELVGLNRSDVNFHERECVVTGKGNKQRMVYFDARTKLHLHAYLESRQDDNPALFTSLHSPENRISVSSVESRIRKLGKVLDKTRVHPHKFRRTVATFAIEKGMPIEQVQKMLGHARIDTTMHYAIVNQNCVKASHRRYLE